MPRATLNDYFQPDDAQKVKQTVKASGGSDVPPGPADSKLRVRLKEIAKVNASKKTPVSGNKSGSAATKTSSSSIQSNVGQVTAKGGLNVRSGPGTKYKSLGVLKYNARMTIFEEKTGWYRILFNNAPGWVSATYVKKIKLEASTKVDLPPPSQAKAQAPVYAPSIEYITYDKTVSENKAVSSSKTYAKEPLLEFDMPEYTRAKMVVHTKETGSWVSKVFEFVIGPNGITRSDITSVSPLKTGGGFILMRSGKEMTRLNLTGYLLDSRITDERRVFLDHYYKRYLVDQINAFNEYFNENRVYIEIAGYRYGCVLTNLDLAQTANSMFLYTYSMGILVTSEEPLGNLKGTEVVYLDGKSQNSNITVDSDVVTSAPDVTPEAFSQILATVSQKTGS